jgi:pimeloyl-ACP methyl ester carboxylesterase
VATFVLVPGAWLGGWAWKRVIPLLEEQGHDTRAITLTGMGERVHLASEEVGIETAVQDVLNVIKYEGLDDLILVGHSFAGKVIATVADRVPERVRLLLYLDAFRPQKVRTPQGGFPDEFPVDGWRVPFTVGILDMLGKDVQGADREWLLSKATPLPVQLFRDPVALSTNFDSIKSAYIFCTRSGDLVDEILSGKWGKLDGPNKVIESGHWPMITRPKELAEDMLALMRASAPQGG